MTTIYHGGEKLESKVNTPLFLYEDISDSIYYATGYSGVENTYVTEFTLNSKAKVLDLSDDKREENERFINEIMKKCGLTTETEYQLVTNSYEQVGREVYAYDIDLVLFPKVKEELLKAGFNVLKNHTVMENTQPLGYAVLDSSVIDVKRQYQLTHDDNEVHLKVTQENNVDNEQSMLGKKFVGKTGYGDIVLEEVLGKKTNKKKM